MGRWSQRRRRGGGGLGSLSPSACNPITDAAVIDSDTLHVTFRDDVDCSGFTDGDMVDNSTGGHASNINQISAKVCEFNDWNAGIGNGEHYTLTSDNPPVCSPQTGTMHT